MFSFKNITWKVNNRTILNNLSANLKANKLTAIMGGSGAGKTSLFRIISGRTAEKYQGEISVNKTPISNADLLAMSGYVHQFDILPEDETVEEYLQFVSYLKVGHTNIEHLIDILGLKEIRKSIIGGPNAGISGGQKKRVSIAVELIGNPEFIFLDEPTSGLDVFSATKLIKYLKKIERTTIVTIHQPSTEIFNTFDDLIIMKDARIFYKGPTKNFVPYIVKQGFDFPPMTNPADYLFTDVLPFIKYENGAWNRYYRTDPDDLESEVSETEKYIERLIEHNDENYLEADTKIVIQGRKKNKMVVEMFLLFRRYIRSIKRNNLLGIMRLIEVVVYLLTISPIFFNIPSMPGAALNETVRGFLYVVIINIFFGCALNCVDLFYYDARLFVKEFRSGLYSPMSYYISKTCVSIIFCCVGPFITSPIFLLLSRMRYDFRQWSIFTYNVIIMGLTSHAVGILLCCVFSDPRVAYMSIPMMLIPFSTLSGMCCSPHSLLLPLRILQFLSPPRYSLAIMLNNHFYKSTPSPYIKTLIVDFPGTLYSLLILTSMFVVFNLLSVLFLKRRIRNEY